MSRDLAHDARVEHHLDLALSSLEAGLLAEAQTQIEASLRLDPGHLTARLVQARIHLAAARPVEALAAVEAMNLYHPAGAKSPQAGMLRAQALLHARMDAIARTQLQQLTTDFPDDVRPHRLLAQLNLREERWDDAVQCLRHVVRLAPSDDASRRLLAQLIADSQPDASAKLLEDAGESSSATRLRLAELYRMTDRHRDAQSLYDQLLEQYPHDPSVWLSAGRLADGDGAVDLARRRLERAATLQGRGNSSAMSALALMHMHAGRFEAAGRCWFRVTRRTRDDMRAWAGLLVCAVMCGRIRLAQRAARPLEVQSSKSERRLLLADLWQRAAGGRVIAQHTAADEEVPAGHANSLDRLLRRAAEVFERQIHSFPRRADAHYHLAASREAIGQIDAAKNAVQDALDINPAYRAAANLRQRLAA